MPVLQNARHEKFAQEIAKGKTQAESYELAGYKPSEHHASRLASNGKVQARVAELQGRGAERAAVTIESLISEAEAARAMAMKTEQPAAAISAITAKAKLAGLWVEKTDNTNRVKRDATDYSRTELAAILGQPHTRNGSNGTVAPNGRAREPDSVH